MTSYSGSLRFDASGQAVGVGQFAISIAGTMSITSGTLSGGTLSGYTSAFATVSADVWGFDGEHLAGDSAQRSVYGGYFSAPLDGFIMPWSSLLGSGITSYNETYTYNADRSVIYATLNAGFDGYDSGYYLTGTASAAATLFATSSAYSIAGAQARLAEGSGGTTAYTFTVLRQGNATATGTVFWQVAGSGAAPATGADFANGLLPSGALAFSGGQTSRTLTIQIAADARAEADETFIVSVSQNPGEVMITTPSAVGTIENDDISTISIVSAMADRPEGSAGTTAFTFTLTRAGDASASASILWSVQGSGVRPADALDFAGGVLPSGTVALTAGQTSKTITVQVAGDAAREGSEGFTVSLVPPLGAALGMASADGVIRADEALTDIMMIDAGTGLALPSAPSFYAGPVAGLERELLAIVPQNVTAVASGPNWFVHTGSGDDAIRVHSGRNVVDGGTGSNFLTGAGGEDTFFLDARGQTLPIWSTLVDFGAGDSATIWGLTQSSATLLWQDGRMAGGRRGLPG